MNDNLHLLAGAYAVDALDRDEQHDFAHHLRSCPTCRIEVTELRDTAALLSELAPVTPSAQLRDSVLDSIRSTRPLPPKAHGSAAAPQPTSIRAWRRTAASRRTTGLLAAAAVIVAAVLVWQPWNQTPASQIEQIMAAADAQRIVQALPGGGEMTVYRSASLDKAAVSAHGLPDPGPGKVYEIWLQDDAGAMIPAAVLDATETDETVLAGSAAQATAAGVTVEPSGGSEAPTSEPVMLFGFEETEGSAGSGGSGDSGEGVH